MEHEIQNILDRFDFDAVHRYMTFVKWVWGSKDKAPSTQELRHEAERLLRLTAKYEGKNTSVSSGGFHALKWSWGELELIFALEEECERIG